MSVILNTKSIYYNDCNLIAQLGKVKSRDDVPVELNRIIVSPMQAIVGETFAIEAARLGLTICLHRFMSPESQRDIYEKIDHNYLNKYNTQNVYCSVKLNDIDRIKYLENFSCPRNWCLDIANGYIPQVENTLEEMLKYTKIHSLIIGNVHSLEGFDYLTHLCYLLKIPKAIIRCGIAGGTPCKTSDITGINRGNITEIMECKNSIFHYNAPIKTFNGYICADGGISKPSFAAKAFAAGADYIMMGGYWMNAIEAESNLTGDGSYWGGASHKQQILMNGKITRHSEGKEIKIERELKSLLELVEDLWGGLSSYVSYSGYNTLTDAIGNGVFELKENSLPPKNRI